MIVPCIDIMDGKVVQLVRGREKVLEAGPPLETLRRFKDFREIQVIDLNAAIGTGDNSIIVDSLVSRAPCRVGGGIRSAGRARSLIAAGAKRVIIGTAAFSPAIEEIAAAVGPEQIFIALDSYQGKIVTRGWREMTDMRAEDVIGRLSSFCGGFLCTCVDNEGLMQGTDLLWFRRLRAATVHPITAAGGIATMEEIQILSALKIDVALGMTIYSNRLNLDALAAVP